MLNKVMLIGNVGRDPEIRYIDGNNPSGGNAKVASFTLATSERYRDRNGEQKESTEWHNIVAWRNLADLAEKFIRKGTQIYVEGRIRTREFTDQTGAKRYRTEIYADVIQLLGRRSDNPAAGSDAAPRQGGFQPRQGGYSAPAGGYAPTAPQGGFAPQGGYPAPQSAPVPEPIDISADSPDDDLPF